VPHDPEALQQLSLAVRETKRVHPEVVRPADRGRRRVVDFRPPRISEGGPENPIRLLGVAAANSSLE
jgi:hypothetical protein